MNIFLMQVKEGVELVNSVTADKSETFTIIVIGMVITGVVIWRWEARANKEDARQEKREEAQMKKDEKDSESLRIVGDSTVRTANATEMMAKTVRVIETRQLSDRRAIVHVIDAINEQPDNPRQAKEYLERAKSHLLND